MDFELKADERYDATEARCHVGTYSHRKEKVSLMCSITNIQTKRMLLYIHGHSVKFAVNFIFHKDQF